MEFTNAPPPISNGKSVLILYCGGAIGMKYDSNGSLAPAKGYLSEEIDSFKEFQQSHMPSVVVKESEELLDSSLMGPEHWAKIAADIEENYYLHDGFVIIMGTDTMAYASSAMSFMLENLGKPVIFTGFAFHIRFLNSYYQGLRFQWLKCTVTRGEILFLLLYLPRPPLSTKCAFASTIN